MKEPSFWPLAPLAVRLKRVDDTINKLRQLSQRWDNRLVLEGFPLTKLYLDGRVAIALIVDVSGGAGPDVSSPLDNSPIGGHNSTDGENRAWRNRRRVLFLILSDANNNVIGDNDRGDEHAVLLHSVKLVESNETRVAPSLVRFYDISNYQREIGRGSLYKSVTTGSYEVVPVATKREIGSFSDSRLAFKNLSGDEIKGCTEIVNDIPNDRGNNFRKALGSNYRDMVAFASGSAILVGASGINVLLDKASEPRFKLVDVLVGPFDL